MKSERNSIPKRSPNDVKADNSSSGNIHSKTGILMKRKLLFLCACVFFLANSQIGYCEHVKVDGTGHYLSWNDKTFIPVGDSVTQGWFVSGEDFDHEGYIDALASRNMNTVLLWSFFCTNDYFQVSRVDRIGVNTPEIWPWKKNRNTNKFEFYRLDPFNQRYFNNLRDFVSYAESRNMIVIITVWDGWSKGNRWSAHPFNIKSGGPLTNKEEFVDFANYGSEIRDAADSGWSPQKKNQYIQEKFAKKLIETLRGYENVIYEMFNEGEWYDNEGSHSKRNRHEQHFLKLFKTHAPKNLLMTNTSHIEGDTPHHDKQVDIVSLHTGWTSRWSFSHNFANSFLHNHPPKPYMNSEPGNGWRGTKDEVRGDEHQPGLADIRRSVWETTLAGAGWVNQNDPSFGWNDKVAMAHESIKVNRDMAYDYAGYCAKFLNRTIDNIGLFKPMNSITTTKIALGRAGHQYIVYSPERDFWVDLPHNQEFSAFWINPEDGTYHRGGKIVGRKGHHFRSPFTHDVYQKVEDKNGVEKIIGRHDAVLYLTKKSDLVFINDFIQPRSSWPGDPISSGDQVIFTGHNIAGGDPTREIYANRWVKGNDCRDNSKTFHWSFTNDDEYRFTTNKDVVFDEGLNTIGYMTFSKKRNSPRNKPVDIRVSNCATKTFFVGPSSCNVSNLGLCRDFLECGLAGGYWCNSKCQKDPCP